MELDIPKKNFFRIQNPNGTETRAFLIQLWAPVFYDSHFKAHHHDSSREPEFGELSVVFEYEGSASTDLLTMRLMVYVKSFVYGTFSTGIIMRLNIDDYESEWQRIMQPRSPHRWYPKLISLRDKLYVFGGIPTTLTMEVNYDNEPFGEVYDPESDHWSNLVAPPQSPLLHQYFDSLFVASLGETEGKIMVYYPIPEVSVLYIYDVDTEVWETRPCSVLDDVLVANSRISGSEVITEHDQMLYWLDKRTALIYAFNWKQQKLYSGAIIGLESEHGFNSMICETNFVSLHHLSRDLFYLFWYTRNLLNQSYVETLLHFTVLRVVTYPSLGALDAFVVGCRRTIVGGSYCSYDAVNV